MTSQASHLKQVLEAMIFASGEPVTLRALLKALDDEPREHVEEALAQLVREWTDRNSGLQLLQIAGGYQFATRAEFHDRVSRLVEKPSARPLSRQALETLAVIAYRQPVTGPDISNIRGTNTSGVVGTLLDHELIKVVGRKNATGRPYLYGTTRKFLEKFGLNKLKHLPKIEQMADALGIEFTTEAMPGTAGTEEPAAESEPPAGKEAGPGLANT